MDRAAGRALTGDRQFVSQEARAALMQLARADDEFETAKLALKLAAHERAKHMLLCRKVGLTWRQIGAVCGLSKSSAYITFVQHQNEIEAYDNLAYEPEDGRA